MKKEEILKRCEDLLKIGIMVPRNDMIKEENDILNIIKAANINNILLDKVKEMIKPGVKLKDIDSMIYNEALKHNAYPASLNYEGFPNSISISINDCIAHGIPSDYIIKDGDVCKADLAVRYNNYYADACRCFIFNNDKALRMYNDLKKIVDELVKEIKPWHSFLGDIGAYIYDKALSLGYDVVVELGGHGVGLEFHEEPFIPFKALKGTDFLIVPGMVFTIEPIFTLGSAKIKYKKNGIYTRDGSIGCQIEYTVLVEEDGLRVLSC